MKSTIYIDAEFTDLVQPKLLSLGMVTSDGQEHYVELDLADPASAGTLKHASGFVLDNGVLEQWGRIPDSATSHFEMGKRTARWLLTQTARLGEPTQITFDYETDYNLLKSLLQDAGQWEAVRSVTVPQNVGEWSNRLDGSLGASFAYDQLQGRGLERHHALADAHALRAACYAVDTGKRLKL